MDDKARDTIARALGRVPSGCCVMTACAGGKSTGMLASWVQQAAFEPPMISACVKRGRSIEPLIDESGHFVLNLLGADPQPMFKHFGKGFTPDEAAFEGLSVTTREAGVVIEGCVGHLGCRVVSKNEAGDHWVYLAEVLYGDATDGEPYVHVRKNGSSY